MRATDLKSAAKLLAPMSDREIAEVLAGLSTGQAVEVLEEFPRERRATIAAETAAGPDWLEGHRYPEGSVGRLMERAPAVFSDHAQIGVVIDTLRDVIRTRQIVYVFCVDTSVRFTGVVAFRELLFSERNATLASVMVQSPFWLQPGMPLEEAMREVVTRHYPVYPVCSERGYLLGQVRGSVLFEQQAFEISAQAGSMVGVEKEERLATPWPLAAVPPPVVATQSADRFRCGCRRRRVSGHHRPHRAARSVHPGTVGTVQQYRLPGPGRDPARHDLERGQARQRAAPDVQGSLARIPQWRSGRCRRRNRDVCAGRDAEVGRGSDIGLDHLCCDDCQLA